MARVHVRVTDEDERLLHLLDHDPRARQLLRWFADLPDPKRAAVHRDVRTRITARAPAQLRAPAPKVGHLRRVK